MNDPLVDYSGMSEADWQAFFRYAQRFDLDRGAIAERNQSEGQWNNRFDLRLEQELPGAMAGHESSVFMVMENVGNFLSKDWGTYYQSSFPQDTEIVSATITPNGQYRYTGFNAADAERKVLNLSVWSVRFGVKYEF